MTESDRTIRRLVGVYDADGTVTGELAYFVGARLGRAHCALCDITHGLVRERADWKARRASLPVPFATYHRNDQPESVRRASNGVVAVVAAETGTETVILLGPEDLERCAGSVDALVAAIEQAVGEQGLSWATA